MPKLGRCSGKEGSGGWLGVKRVERAGAIAPGDHAPGPEILHRETKGVKLDRTGVISGELTNRDKISDNVGRDKNIIETEVANGCRPSRGDG